MGRRPFLLTAASDLLSRPDLIAKRGSEAGPCFT
jgi:hypothetical protein